LFGPGEDKERLVPYLINRLEQNQEALCLQGIKKRDYLFVKDAALAIVKLFDSSLEGAVNIASGKAISIVDLATMIGETMKKKQLINYAISRDSAEPEMITADISRLKDELKWSPHYSLPAAVKETITWCRRERT